VIDLITRVRTPALYERMLASAKKTASDPFEAHFELDTDNLPKIAETYNRLAGESKADILGFVHDDIEFLSDNWDGVIHELFAEYDADIIGVVGTTKYEGGRIFDSGTEHALGHFCCIIGKENAVKILSRAHRYTPASVVDGMLMFCRKSFWDKEPFDMAFDELFFYDTDFCLRGKVGVTTNITVKHSKPAELYGKYPDALKPISFYEEIFNKKHGFTTKEPGYQGCAVVLLSDFERLGINYPHDQFMKRRNKECVSQ
jgi:hypothetical protein